MAVRGRADVGNSFIAIKPDGVQVCLIPILSTHHLSLELDTDNYPHSVDSSAQSSAASRLVGTSRNPLSTVSSTA